MLVLVPGWNQAARRKSVSQKDICYRIGGAAESEIRFQIQDMISPGKVVFDYLIRHNQLRLMRCGIFLHRAIEGYFLLFISNQTVLSFFEHVNDLIDFSFQTQRLSQHL